LELPLAPVNELDTLPTEVVRLSDADDAVELAAKPGKGAKPIAKVIAKTGADKECLVNVMGCFQKKYYRTATQRADCGCKVIRAVAVCYAV
jgi:hypothetical protein